MATEVLPGPTLAVVVRVRPGFLNYLRSRTGYGTAATMMVKALLDVPMLFVADTVSG